jgi:tol-pal system protein YbgF
MRRLAPYLLLVALGCATADAPEPILATPPPPDPRVGELQTQMTELLERLDVLNERIARVEEGNADARPSEARATEPIVAAPRPAATRPAAPRPSVPATAEPAQAAVTASGEPQRALVGAALADNYRQAIILVGRGRHADAREIFEQVFAADSGGDLADNALFWIGETYFSAGDFTNAVRFYTRVVNEYPDQNKAPDALLKTALAQAKTGDLALARRTLQQVIDRYPFSSTASSAKAELQRIRY